MGTVRVKDVAARAGVSLGTVSNVLNRRESVRPETRRRVEAAIAELGYVRNESARQLRAGGSRLLAHVVPDAGNPFFAELSRHAQERARAAGLALILCDSDSDSGIEDDYLALLLEQRVRGVLITAVDYANPRLRELPARGVPVVLVDRIEPDGSPVCSVGVDDVTGGRLAVTHLIDEGHDRIAFVGTPTVLPQVADRFRGARDALVTAGLDAERLTLVETPGLTPEDGRAAGQRLLGIPAAVRPTAAFCANDLLALGLLQEMTSHGLLVPDDLAIVGYDDIYYAGAAAVPLSSVRQPREQLAARAVELIGDEASRGAEHAHRQVVLDAELVVRASSRRRRAPGAPSGSVRGSDPAPT